MYVVTMDGRGDDIPQVLFYGGFEGVGSHIVLEEHYHFGGIAVELIHPHVCDLGCRACCFDS